MTISKPGKTQTKIYPLLRFLEAPNAYLLTFLLVCVGIFTFRDYLSLKKLYIFLDIGSDSYNQVYPYFVSMADYIRQEGIPSWSFYQGMGQNIFPGEILNPFHLILFLIGRNNIPYGIAYVELLKIIFGGIIFYYYLKTLSMSQYTCVVGGVLFAFSGYMVLGSGWYGHSTFVVLGIFVLFSFEKLFKEGVWFYFPVSVALLVSRSPFYLYVVGVFLLVYSVFRILDDHSWDLRSICTLYLKIAGLGLLGLAFVAPFLANDLLRMLQSPRVGGEASLASRLMARPFYSFGTLKHNATAILRLFSNDILGVGSYFKGWINYLEAPTFYCGLSSLLLLPQIFHFLTKKRKIVFLAFLFVWLLVIIFPFLRYAFYLFTGDYYKGGLSFIVPIVILFFSLHALDSIDKRKEVNGILLLCTLGTLLVLLYFPYFPEGKNIVVKEIRTVITVFLVIYAALIYSYGRSGHRVLRLLFLAAICVEAYMFSFVTTNERYVLTAAELQKPVGYNDNTVKAVSQIKSEDKGFFRIEKDYSSGKAIHGSLNDAQIQGYYGTKSYHQFNQKYYIEFLVETGIIRGDVENMTRWAPGLVSRPLLQTLASVKYYLSKKRPQGFYRQSYRPYASYGDVSVMQNNNFLPLGFTYDRYVTYSDFTRLNPLQKDITLLKAFVAEDGAGGLDDFEAYRPENLGKEYSFREYEEDVSRLRRETLTLIKHDQNSIKGTIQVKNKKLLFFSIPYDTGWTIKIDGVKVKPMLINIGFMGAIIPEGSHAVELKFTPPFLFPGLLIMAISLMLYIFLYISDIRRRGGFSPELTKRI